MMRTVAIVRAFWIVLAAVGFLTACDKSPTSPAREPAPTPRVDPGMGGIEMVGPGVVPLGETVQFNLIARLTDGSTRDVTNEARWSASGGQVSISSPGLVTGRERGQARVTADFDKRYGAKDVIVLPAGTYRLQGWVTEAGFPNVGVAGARVEVTTGVGAGLAADTGWYGGYALYGVSGETALRVTKDGYQTAVATVFVADHQGHDTELRPLGPRAEVSGIYSLTIAAADHCGVGLGQGHVPEEARVRTYTAEVRQEGPALALTLSGATFLGWSRDAAGRHVGVRGRVEPGRVVFLFPWGDGNEFPYVLEQLPTSRSFFVAGNVVATGSANRFAGTLAGDLAIYDGILGPNDITGPQAIAWCSSTSHQFVLWR